MCGIQIGCVDAGVVTRALILVFLFEVCVEGDTHVAAAAERDMARIWKYMVTEKKFKGFSTLILTKAFSRTLYKYVSIIFDSC